MCDVIQADMNKIKNYDVKTAFLSQSDYYCK